MTGAFATERHLNTQKPEKIGKYDVLDVLGRGGMGVVYRARDSRLGRIVAIKMLTEGFSGNADMLQRFYREASQTGALRHNNIVIVYDAGDQDGEPYIVMEYVEGEPLDKSHQAQKRVPLEHALSVVEQVCLALAYAHRNGVIHRDVKPANVIVHGTERPSCSTSGSPATRPASTTSRHQYRVSGWHAALHGSRTVPGSADRWPVRYLLRRRASLSVGHRKAAFRCRLSRGD